ncbi:hypothetical protein [Alkalicoccobacillus plakortidis]|uniref:Uncharacterized protein n=1 Tax=Alkalicoccobacillus plakortidis TaxID=444060 RepID=A0ABT0XF77_9BACI|nr:hypothetical protein [Alkalicoccobacillus plakortidis]MCM2674546.1 hypothetical protein [Alkalicoccobacillus plakortidis]
MSYIGEKKDWLKKYIHTNSLEGQMTALNELRVKNSFERNELYELLDELVEDEVVQWTNEEQLISLPLPNWYKNHLENIKICRQSILTRRFSL